jgi:hypothetical protein
MAEEGRSQTSPTGWRTIAVSGRRESIVGQLASRIEEQIVALGARSEVQALDAKAAYLSMAPPDQYLMERNAEILLARSAAPAAVSSDAEVLILGRHGYETGVEGKNGFVCVVERSWTSAFDDPEFWNPNLRVKDHRVTQRQK